MEIWPTAYLLNTTLSSIQDEDINALECLALKARGTAETDANIARWR